MKNKVPLEMRDQVLLNEDFSHYSQFTLTAHLGWPVLSDLIQLTTITVSSSVFT